MGTPVKIEGIHPMVESTAAVIFKGANKKLPSMVLGLLKVTIKMISKQNQVQQAIASPSILMKALDVARATVPYFMSPRTTFSIFAFAAAIAPKQMFNFAGNVANFAVRNLNRLYGPDNVDKHETNLQNLQQANSTTSNLIEDYYQLLHLLAALSTFNPSLQTTQGEAEKFQKSTALHLLRIQKEIQAHRQINLHQVESAILYFMAEFEHALSVHGENICAFPKIIEELKETENRLLSAQSHLLHSKKEMEQTVEEVTKLNELILEAGLEQDKALSELLAQANELIRKSSSSTLLNPSGVSHGITVES